MLKYISRNLSPASTERSDLKPHTSTTVALYFYRLCNAGGGAERMIVQLAGALTRRGFDVHLITWDALGSKSFYPIEPAVRWTQLGFAPGFSDKLRRVWVLYRILKCHQIKTLVGFVMSADRTIYAAARFAGTKIIAAERNAASMYSIRYSRMQRWLIFWLLGLTERITVQLHSYIADYPVRLRARMNSIPNPVPVAASSLCASPGEPDVNGRFTLLTVSRLDPLQKRIACLVGAFAQIAQRFPAWDLRIVGDGPEEEDILRSIHDLGLQGRVRIETSTPHVFEIYAECHLFAIPSKWEGFSNALAEAMSFGLPAVGFAQAPGVAEIISDGGWLASGLDDENALADSLAQAMLDSRERVRRGQIASRSMAQFEPELQFDRWAELINSVTATHQIQNKREQLR